MAPAAYSGDNVRAGPNLRTRGHMEQMRHIAYETVLRACGFASLAIFCVMIGMSFMPEPPSRPADS